ncbi:hypothetical protein Plhal304r1_c008g0030711 [Plasmopara halstedii]
MFSTWDLVRPRFWYPMSSLEQSMMDLEHLSELMSRSSFPFDRSNEMLAAPSNLDDDEFFKDLPVLGREQQPATQHRESSAHLTESVSKTKDQVSKDRDNDPNKPNKKTSTDKHQAVAINDDQSRRAFSSYTFSNSSIVDDKGRRVMSTRRRYEDSTGRLKAVHERQIEGKKMRSTWSRMGPEDEGKHEATCSGGTPDEFEAMWQKTPFGDAQKKTIKQEQQKQLEPEKHSLKPNSKAKEKATCKL